MLGRLWARLRGRRYGRSMWTATGAHFWPLDPRSVEVRIADIARGLAGRCRYQGQIGIGSGFNFYSVAEHSYLVSVFAEKVALERGYTPAAAGDAGRIGLLHDASEAYIADVARPLKYSREMRGYRKIEERVQSAVFTAFAVERDPRLEVLVKEIDNRILVDEMTALMRHGRSLDELRRLHGEPLGCHIYGLATGSAEQLFLMRHEELFG